MAEAPMAAALDAETAARYLLANLGAQTEPRAAIPWKEGDAKELILRHLESRGVHARFARIEKDELRHVELPTLVRLKDARWLLVVRAGRRGVSAQDASGRVHEVPLRVFAESFDGWVLDRIAQLPHGTTLWSRVLRLVRDHRKILYQAGVLALLVQGLNLIVPQLARILVDRAFPDGASSLMWMLVIGMVFVALAQAWFGWLERQLAQHLQTRLDAVLERGLLAHVMRLPYRYLERKTLGQLVQGFEGIARARELLTGQALTVMLGGVTALAFLMLMGRLMPAPTMLVATLGAVTLALVIAIGRRQEIVQQRFVAALVRERGAAAEIFTQIGMLKAAAAEHRRVGRWFELLRREREIGLHGERIAHGTHVAIDLLGQLQIQGLWIWGGLHVLEGSLQLGELIAFTLMAGGFHAAIGNLGRTIATVWTAKPLLRETQLLLQQKPLPLPPPLAAPLAPGAIEIRDLWFRYNEELPWVFSGLNLVVEPGELHRIAGPSGFGKSTLLKLVAGLYEPARGSIRIAGHAPHAAGELMVYLPQFVRLFGASILENLRIFSGGAPFEQLMTAAELTGLAKLVDELPMGYDTLLAQGGENFSGGQRQLIAITAVLACAKPVLLLDEALANLDSLRRAELAHSPLFKSKTILYTSHEGRVWGRSTPQTSRSPSFAAAYTASVRL